MTDQPMSAEEAFIEANVEYSRDADYPCSREGCGKMFPLFALSLIEGKAVCSQCVMNDRVNAQPVPDNVIGWDSETGNGVKAERNILLERWRWTVQPDSPLTEGSKSEFLTYLQTLNRLTVDFADPATVEWPTVPAQEYA